MPGRRRVCRRVWITAPEPAAAPPLRPPLPPARAAASSEDALVKGRGGGGADGCCAQSMAMAMADLLVQEQLQNVPDAEVGESSEMDTPFRGGVFQTELEKAVLLGKDSIQKATANLQGLCFPSYPAAVPAGYMIPQVPYNDAVNYEPNGYAAGDGGGYQNNKPPATMAAATPAALPDDLVEEILLRISPDDPASLLCASLVCKTWSHIAKEQLKRAQQQEQLKRAQLQMQLECAQLQEQLQLECARLQLQFEKEHLEVSQLQEELNQLQRGQPAAAAQGHPTAGGGQPAAAAQARPAWR
ncbi:hypothetical protein ACQJBY_056644 [Aegilops geniculata]